MMLQRTLQANACFSLFCGLVLALFSSNLAELLGTIPGWLLVALGIGLIAFAADVYWISRRLDKARSRALAIFWADVGWLVLTPIVLVSLSNYFSTLGIWLMIEIAVIVAIFALLEWVGIKRYYVGPQPA